MDEAIINHLKKTYNLLIGEPRAEKVKIQIGSASPLEEELTMEIAGRDTISGLPRKIVITSEEIREALKDPVGGIIDAVTSTLEKAEPELAADRERNPYLRRRFAPSRHGSRSRQRDRLESPHG